MLFEGKSAKDAVCGLMSREKRQETEDLTLEQIFEQLENVLSTLESRDITLEDSFSTYAKGMELLKKCNEKIDTVEKKMQLINEEGELSDF